MGNSSHKSSSQEVYYSDDPKEKTTRVVGTDVTYQVNDILRKTDAILNYEDDPIIIREDLPVPGAFVLHNVLSSAECKQFVEIAEGMKFSASPLRSLATVNSDESNLSDATQEIRNSERVLFDVSDQMGVPLNKRIISFLDQKCNCEGSDWEVQKIGSGKAKGPINSRWRFNKYSEGQYFKPHFDAGYQYDHNEKTLYTFILYLSEGFEGGETIFFPGDKKFSWSEAIPGIECKVKPRIGSALVFFQTGELSPRHEGAPHRTPGSYKYILRSDLAYTKV